MKSSLRFRIILWVLGVILILTGLWGSVAGTNWPITFLGGTSLLLGLMPIGDGEDAP